MSERREGGCSCGAVRYAVVGRPTRVGVCHCTLCRKETGSVFMPFAVFPTRQFSFTGDVRNYRHRYFCPNCGSRIFSYEAGAPEMEIKLGTLDEAPTDLHIGYEIWVKRREPWLQPISGAEQFQEDRPK
jgi:hypothetical protein